MSDITQTHEFEGFWWLPDEEDAELPAPEKRLAGKLTISDGWGTLEVLGNFGHEVLGESETETVFSPFPSGQERIVGLASTGECITLLRTHVTASSMRFPGVATTSYKAHATLVGAWVEKDQPVTFDEFSICTSDLDTWVGVSGFHQELIGSEDEDTGRFVVTQVKIEFSPPEPVEIPVGNGNSARIDFSFSSPGMPPVTTEAGVSQSARLYYRFSDTTELDQVFATIKQLRNFLSLAVGRQVAVLSVIAYKDDFVDPRTNAREPIRIFYPLSHNREPTARPLHPSEMLFTLGQAEPNIGAVLSAWLAKQEDLAPVFDLYFGTLYHPDLFLDLKFLLNAQALETYDFRRRDPHELSRDEHAQRMTEVLAGAPEQWREWLTMRLTGSNYRTLDQRMRDILAECPAVSAKIVGATPDDVTRFVRAFKNSRNYYTHYNEALEDRAAEGAELYALTLQLQALIEMSILRELGFSCDAVDQILDRVQRYARIRHFHSEFAED